MYMQKARSCSDYAGTKRTGTHPSALFVHCCPRFEASLQAVLSASAMPPTPGGTSMTFSLRHRGTRKATGKVHFESVAYLLCQSIPVILYSHVDFCLSKLLVSQKQPSAASWAHLTRMLSLSGVSYGVVTICNFFDHAHLADDCVRLRERVKGLLSLIFFHTILCKVISNPLSVVGTVLLLQESQHPLLCSLNWSTVCSGLLASTKLHRKDSPCS